MDVNPMAVVEERQGHRKSIPPLLIPADYSSLQQQLSMIQELSQRAAIRYLIHITHQICHGVKLFD